MIVDGGLVPGAGLSLALSSPLLLFWETGTPAELEEPRPLVVAAVAAVSAPPRPDLMVDDRSVSAPATSGLDSAADCTVSLWSVGTF